MNRIRSWLRNTHDWLRAMKKPGVMGQAGPIEAHLRKAPKFREIYGILGVYGFSLEEALREEK